MEIGDWWSGLHYFNTLVTPECHTISTVKEAMSKIHVNAGSSFSSQG